MISYWGVTTAVVYKECQSEKQWFIVPGGRGFTNFSLIWYARPMSRSRWNLGCGGFRNTRAAHRFGHTHLENAEVSVYVTSGVVSVEAVKTESYMNLSSAPVPSTPEERWKVTHSLQPCLIKTSNPWAIGHLRLLAVQTACHDVYIPEKKHCP